MSNESTLLEIQKAIGAHGAWKLKLRTAIAVGDSSASVADTRCDNKCEFGKWIYGPSLDAATRAGKPYQVIKRLHAEFHVTASRVLELATTGHQQEAQLLMDTTFREQSDKLIRALSKWKGELLYPA